MTRERASDLLEFAVEVAWRAGRTAFAHYQSGLPSEIKSDNSPVTVADRSAEHVARELIERRFPEDGIIGEEFGTVRDDAVRRWILDPIDGTRTFVRGVPFFGCLVALEENHEPIIGVMYFPALEETVCGARGEGAWWNSRRARVSDVAALSDALLLTTDINNIHASGHGNGFLRLHDECGMLRTWGDCYGHALVATGRAEIMLDPLMSVWDAAALKPIIEEAGGRFTSWSGAATHTGGSAVSANAVLADRVLQLLNEQP